MPVNRVAEYFQPSDDDTPVPDSDKQFCENLVRIMRDGGVWGIPRSGLLFRFDKGSKKLVLTMGDADHSDFAATVKAFGAIGWQVVKE